MEFFVVDQKLDNQLNLALSTPEEQRKKTLDLNVGYDDRDGTWEIIVRYVGNLAELLAPYPEIKVVPLLGGFAIITLPQRYISSISALPQIEFVEKPKRLFFALSQALTASCIPPVTRPPFSLDGSGLIVGVIDSGLALTHPDFRNEDGTTRVLCFWDQTATGTPPEGYLIGREYTQQEINEALQNNTPLPVDLSGHGTAVTGIAAGNGRGGTLQNVGVAPKSDIIFVKLGAPRQESFPRTTELMQGINYVITKAVEFGKPLALNLSFGNNYGSHDGTSLIDSFIDQAAKVWKTTISIGTGNEGTAAIHTSGILENNVVKDVELAVGTYQTGFNIQLWKSYVDTFDISIISPSGAEVGPFQNLLGPQRFVLGQTEILLYYGKPTPYSTEQEIYMELIPFRDYVDSGIWTFRLTPRRIVLGDFDMWLPGGGQLNADTRFLFPTPDKTLTVPSTASSAISVGAYDSLLLTYADFSGRGYTRTSNAIKPDIVAPGVNITAPTPEGFYSTFTGTSFATPIVAGSAALMMQWGIVNGNDPFLYGEKVKAYLLRGAQPVGNLQNYPNPRLGFGRLCLRASFPDV